MRIAIGPSVVLAATVLAAMVYGQESASVWDGVYSPEQANQGKAVFSQNCQSCHQEGLVGKLGTAPPLTGAQFKENWNGLTAGDIFKYIKTSMPRGSTTRLSAEDVAKVVAYVFTVNGFPAGQKELPTSDAQLQTIRFDAAKPGTK
jgi:mono/diheme cytochrome c family protein